MTIETRQYPNCTGTVATACPRCDEPLDEQQSLAQHIRSDCGGASDGEK